MWRAPTLAPALAKAADTIDQSRRLQESSSGISITIKAFSDDNGTGFNLNIDPSF